MLRIGQVEATATQDGKYTDGSVAGGIAATRLRAAAFNAMQEELAHIVESAGLALDINDMTQVLKAIQKLTLSRANPFADIKSDGAAAISTALTNLGLKEAAKRDVGTGANQLPDMSSFQSILSTSGYQRLPGGIIIQWGLAPAPVGVASQKSYPITFPNAVWHVFMCHNVPNDPSGLGLSGASVAPGNSVFDYMIQAIKVSGTTVTATPAGTTSMSMHFFAIGY
ncbi:gp53-like domain-containing protein [Escherichia coli]